MAGIAGTIDLRRELSAARPVVRSMLAALVHRGPNGELVAEAGPATLGTRVHAVTDGPSPALSAGHLHLVLDGDILNRTALAASLRARGRTVEGDTQAAAVLAAWEERGPACLEDLEGTFALAVWDARDGRLYCVRDRAGLKPLYYTVADGRFRFASEVRALLADPAVPRMPDDARVLQYLAFGITDHTQDTMLQGIRRVPAGSYVTVSARDGARTLETWYRLRPAPIEGDAATNARTLLEDAVARNLIGSGVVGATLSGGVDSSSVLALAAAVCRREGREPPLAVVARTSDPRADEWPYAELLLKRHGIESLQVWPDDRALVDDVDAFVASLDEPSHGPAVYGHWRVMRAVRDAGVDIVLEGQGGERFGGLGYWYPQIFYDMLRRGRLGSALGELLARRRVQGVPVTRSLADLAKLLLPPSARNAYRIRPGWLAAGVAIEPPPFPGRGLRAQQIYELTIDNALVTREIDRCAAPFGLQERAPFLDRRVVEYGLSLPAEVLFRGGRGKAPLLEAMRGLVPDEILDRPVKQGFTVDQQAWLHGAFGDAVADVFRSEAAASRPYWDARAVLRLLDTIRSGGGASPADIWRAYSVERWLELVVESTTPLVRAVDGPVEPSPTGAQGPRAA